MSVPELFIRRPVMTTLVMSGILLFGLISYRYLAVSDLPNVDYPTILVQANLVPNDQDHALSTDTNALVSELIAFVDDSQDETCAPSCAVPASIHSDPMASVLH